MAIDIDAAERHIDTRPAVVAYVDRLAAPRSHLDGRVFCEVDSSGTVIIEGGRRDHQRLGSSGQLQTEPGISVERATIDDDGLRARGVQSRAVGARNIQAVKINAV